MRVATDIGGTFTDLVAVDDQGKTILTKSHTTPPNFEEGVIKVIQKSILAASTAAETHAILCIRRNKLRKAAYHLSRIAESKWINKHKCTKADSVK